MQILPVTGIAKTVKALANFSPPLEIYGGRSLILIVARISTSVPGLSISC
jgi:hypothetical protein